MYTLPNPTHFSVFLDATELYSSKDLVAVPAHVTPSLVRVTYYISTATVDELAVLLVQDYEKVQPAISRFAPLMSSCGIEVDLDYFRHQIIERLKAVPHVRIFDRVPHGVVEQELLFKARHRGAYKDALVFASSLIYARDNNLPRCTFVTSDKQEKDFIDLRSTLDEIYPIKLLKRDEFKQMINVGAELYDEILAALDPQIKEEVLTRRRELVSRARFKPTGLHASQEAIDFLCTLIGIDSDLSPLSAELMNVGLAPADAEDGRKPNEVICRFVVRYAIPGLYSRLFFGRARAELRYDRTGGIEDSKLADFELSWTAHG